MVVIDVVDDVSLNLFEKKIVDVIKRGPSIRDSEDYPTRASFIKSL